MKNIDSTNVMDMNISEFKQWIESHKDNMSNEEYNLMCKKIKTYDYQDLLKYGILHRKKITTR